MTGLDRKRSDAVPYDVGSDDECNDKPEFLDEVSESSDEGVPEDNSDSNLWPLARRPHVSGMAKKK
jgi:hypothetical protein